MTDRLRIGDMLVEAGLIKPEQLEAALVSQRSSGLRIGAELVAQGVLDEVQLTQVVSNQLSVPWVSLYHVEFSRDLLNLISPEFAEEHLVIPIYVRQLRGGKKVLFVAMVDPTNDPLLEELSSKIAIPVKPMIAPPSEIENAIGAYYFGRRPSTTLPPTPAQEAQSPTEAVKSDHGSTPMGAGANPKQEKKQKHSSAPARTKAPSTVGARKSEKKKGMPSMAQMRANMVTLTLLDGTSVRLPAPGSDTPTQQESLTASDLISALRARAQGKDVSKVLPDTGWENLFATLLTLLIRKGLIADWEFAQEWSDQDGEKRG